METNTQRGTLAQGKHEQYVNNIKIVKVFGIYVVINNDSSLTNKCSFPLQKQTTLQNKNVSPAKDQSLTIEFA